MPGGYLSGSSATTTMRFAPSAATCRAIWSDAQAAVDLLAAGHRHRVVEMDPVGDVDAGDRRGADGEAAGMVVGAVADVLEDMAAGRERRLADPVGAFRAHLGVALGLRGPSAGPCSGSRCRHRRGSLPARRCRCCRGSRSRNSGVRVGDVLALGEHGLGRFSCRDPRLELAMRRRAPACARRWRWRCGSTSSAPFDGRSQSPVSSLLADDRRRRRRAVEDLLDLRSRSGRASPRRR